MMIDNLYFSIQTLIIYLVLGLVAGFLASMVLKDGRHHIVTYIIIGIIGAVVGGIISGIFLHIGITGFDIPSIVIAFLGAVLVLLVYREITGRRGKGGGRRRRR